MISHCLSIVLPDLYCLCLSLFYVGFFFLPTAFVQKAAVPSGEMP